MLFVPPKLVLELKQKVASHLCPWNMWVKGGGVLSWVWRQPHPLPLIQLLSPQRWGWAGLGPAFLGKAQLGAGWLSSPWSCGANTFLSPLHFADSSGTPVCWRRGRYTKPLAPGWLQRHDVCSRAATLGASARDWWSGDPGEWHLIHFRREASASEQAFTVISTWSLCFMMTSAVTSSLSGRNFWSHQMCLVGFV